MSTVFETLTKSVAVTRFPPKEVPARVSVPDRSAFSSSSVPSSALASSSKTVGAVIRTLIAPSSNTMASSQPTGLDEME